MAAPITKITFAEDLGPEVVNIYVGSQQYFDKALNGNFKEANENSIHLEEDDPAAVGLLIGWLYRGVIPGLGKTSTPFVKGPRPPATSIFASKIAMSLPQSGTLFPPFIPLKTRDLGQLDSDYRDSFQSICFQAEYMSFSPEELRLSDYRDGRRYISSISSGGSVGGATSAAPLATTVGAQATPTGPAAPSLSSDMGVFGATSVATTSPLFFSALRSQARPQNEAANTPVEFPNGSTAINFNSPNIFGTPPVGTGVSMTPLSGAQIVPSSSKSQLLFRSRSRRSSPSPASLDFNLIPTGFGSTATISYPKSPGIFLNGIPRSVPLKEDHSLSDDYQVSVLLLCLLAETLCWPSLFNAAIDAYIQGERNRHRPIPPDHVDLIYEQAHFESTLRSYVVDSISNLEGGQDHLVYLPVAKKHEAFLEDVFQKLSCSGLAAGSGERNEEISKYQMPGAEKQK